MIYTFLCSTETPSARHDGTVPVEGMKLVAALAHKYGIPVTWIVDAQSAEAGKDIITGGHSECNDDVIVKIDPSIILKRDGLSKAEEIVILRQELPDLITSQRRKIKELFPWASANVISADPKTSALVEILEEIACTGLWGYRWGDSKAEDLGCPWSFFYANRNRHNIPANYSGKVVAAESISLDLNAVFHSENPCIFSADPTVLARSGLCTSEDFTYGKALLGEYLKNSAWNRFLIFVQHQKACDMEYASYNSYNRGTIARIADIMEGFFREVTDNPQVQILSLPQAVDLYREEFDHTEPCFMAFDSIVPPFADINFYIPPVPKKKPPYPLIFLYYDRECQLVFKEGQMTPVEIRNYIHPPLESKYYIEKDIPAISSFRPFRDRDKLIMEFEIETTKRMPYGLAIWDDHSMFSLVSTDAKLVKWIGTYLLFMRVDLEEGLNQIEVSLSI